MVIADDSLINSLLIIMATETIVTDVISPP